MRATVTALLPVIGFCGHSQEFDQVSEASSQERLNCLNQASAETQAGEFDVYKLAVLLLVGAAVLSIF